MSNKIFYVNSEFEAKAAGKSKALKIAGYANTVAKDRSGDVITPQAWSKGVENFRKNPIMLLQHKHEQPIGRFDKIKIDNNGIFVEGTVSAAAEKNYGVHTLIQDNALKSFSVGFIPKKAKFDKATDTTYITELELLEISIVSVPDNQDSLFSIKKSFDTEADYKAYVKSIAEIVDTSEEEVEEIKELSVEIDTTETEEKTVETSEVSEIIEEPQLEVKASESEELVDPVEVKEVESTTAVTEVISLEEELGEELVKELDPYEMIPLENALFAKLIDGAQITINSKTYKALLDNSGQSPMFKFLQIDDNAQSCNNTNNVEENNISEQTISEQTIKSEDTSEKNFNESLHEDSTKETNIMAEQVVDSIDLKNTSVETNTVATVKEPRVAELVEKTGEAILREADQKDKYGEYTPAASDEVKELRNQVSKYKEEIKSMQTSKMHYAENSRASSQFSNKEMANAVILAKMLNKHDVFDTKMGARMKAVTSVDQFLSNFSRDVYTELEQQLVIAPLFTRMPVDAKTFRVPVADEDTDGDVAMFRSGTYATGIADSTNVPVSNQHSLSAVEFTPHKFMASTHLAKDEEEDTILPLIDFLRTASTRRMARAIDKSILRGTGALTGFTASPTNAITAGTGYASVIEGITNLTGDASLTVATGSATDKADPSDIAAARAQMGKYGLQLGGDLVYITSVEGYNNLVTTSDFRTVDTFGPHATYLTGSVGAVYGIPIIVSEFLDNAGTTGNHLGVLLYKPGFLIAERRAMEIESEYDPRRQVTAMYMSTRFDFKALTTNSNAALDGTKYAFASTVVAGA